MTSKRKKSSTNKKRKKQNNKTYYSLMTFAFIVIIFIALLRLGVVGAFLDAGMAYVLGESRFFTYLVAVLAGVYMMREQKVPFTRRMGGYLLLQFGLLFLLHSVLYISNQPRTENFYSFNEIFTAIREPGGSEFFGGGVFGQLLFAFSSTGVSLFGTLLLSIIFIYFSILLITHKNIADTLTAHTNKLVAGLQAAGLAVARLFTWLYNAIKDAIQTLFDNRKVESAREDKPTQKSRKRKADNIPAATAENPVYQEPKTLDSFSADESIIEDMHSFDRESNMKALEQNKKEAEDRAEMRGPEAPVEQPVYEPDADDAPAFSAAREDALEIAEAADEPQQIEYESEDFTDTVAPEPGEGESEIAEFEEEELKKLIEYQLPSISLLDDAEVTEKVSNQEVLSQGKILEETLKNFGVNAKVSKIRIGPAVTQFEVQPDIGVKVSKIINLQNDIALSLAAKDIRIEAPIPGKSAVGIEVPNSVISMVTLREVLKRKTSSNPLEVALGKDISGAPILAELNKMPHLLVAGATGSGKSVCINGIIISLLMNAKPHEVKLMMIDPKMVELNVYNGIPHLLSPVVTNPQKASDALNRIVSEMERRYDLFSHSHTRNIEAYNQYLERESEHPEKVQKLPYIVVIIDELADLMMVASKDVEASITRIAQMARAAGIHLIIATQRPSVDVITGIIKANIPSRIAFSVSSNTDSRTILDTQGAEKLLGRGDMLFLPSGRSKPLRVQGAFLADNEVYDVVEFITAQMKANYEKSIMNNQPQKEEVESEDELYPDAKWFVIEEQRASASLLQRQFRVGYNRAARLIDDLEANGVIGPASGSKPRNVLVKNDE
ncbi:DNA segregation ATPase FtsK/SpoIIIE, S-DNA-T family [Lacicoccus alkaliphilus]|uniref:DNA segregation ATPase FtsK/SpoIIIE, S-DNA-T family n=3 Tax=Lacicoccus TaxID=3076172 RepID=A0A1M7C3P3_9BACL|nr:DNA translocase FtsK [Salinicoccus alkaliphilus]SHL61834.1 DNA segregation ATPase FtsK/SpoIIIE, S-DNA-T family [Salinicoccus alkaliphilus DSM 16010]